MIRILIFLSLFFKVGYAQQENSYLESGLKQCDVFVENYKPIYIVGKDTFAVPRIPMPSNELNFFLFKCIADSNFVPLKYTYIILAKQSEEFDKNSPGISDYVVDEYLYDNNGFFKMLVEFMKKENFFEGEFFYSELSTYMYQNRCKIEGLLELREKYCKKKTKRKDRCKNG